MKLLSKLWKKLTHTKALELASGDFEIFFFAFLYRVQYIAGHLNKSRSVKSLLNYDSLNALIHWPCKQWLELLAKIRYLYSLYKKDIRKKGLYDLGCDSPRARSFGSDIDYYFKTNDVLGFSVVDRNFLYLIYSNTVRFLLVLMGCSEIWHFFSITLTIDGVIDGVNLILIQIGALYKYKTMLDNIKVFNSLASAMKSPNFDLTTKERRNIFKLWGQRNEAWLKLLLCLGTCTLLAWHIYPLVDVLEYNLMVVIRLPFDYQTPTLYPITYISTLIVFSYISYFVMVNDLIMQAHLMHLLCQFAVLNDCFENILTDCRTELHNEELHTLHLNQEFREKYVKRLGSLVDQHNFIINNTSKLRDIFSAPMLVQLGVSTTLICSIGFQVATSVRVNLTKWIMSLLYLGYNMFGLYIICRWSEEVKIQSIKIGEAVYCSGWEQGIVSVPGVRTSILLILARANKPVGLSGGGMYELSLMAYANMVKTSYSALTVLLRLR